MTRPIWKPEDRQIYKFHDGSKVRAVDPLEIQRKLASIPDMQATVTTFVAAQSVALRADAKRAKGETLSGLEVQAEKELLESMNSLIAGLRQVFEVSQVQVIDESGNTSGLTDTEMMLLSADFNDYCDDLKKNTVLTPTCTPATGCPTESTMNASAVCISTVKDKSSEVPCP